MQEAVYSVYASPKDAFYYIGCYRTFGGMFIYQSDPNSRADYYLDLDQSL